MTAKQFIKKYPNSDHNENSLRDIACPKCGNRSSFAISSQTTFFFSDEGASEFTGIEFDNDSSAQCMGCNRIDQVNAFTIEGLDDLLEQAADKTE